MTVVLDCNILVMCLPSKSPYYFIYKSFIDPDDNKYCDCAVVGKANFIITEDRHFNVLESIAFPSLKSIGIEKFTKLLKNL